MYILYIVSRFCKLSLQDMHRKKTCSYQFLDFSICGSIANLLWTILCQIAHYFSQIICGRSLLHCFRRLYWPPNQFPGSTPACACSRPHPVWQSHSMVSWYQEAACIHSKIILDSSKIRGWGTSFHWVLSTIFHSRTVLSDSGGGIALKMLYHQTTIRCTKWTPWLSHFPKFILQLSYTVFEMSSVLYPLQLFSPRGHLDHGQLGSCALKSQTQTNGTCRGGFVEFEIQYFQHLVKFYMQLQLSAELKLQS